MLPHFLAFLALLFITLQSQAQAQDLQRGKLLHDTHCVSCHDARIYSRSNRVANDADRLRLEVDRWRKNISLPWEQGEIDAVTAFLASRYYGIECGNAC